jgi:hypothetical protein
MLTIRVACNFETAYLIVQSNAKHQTIVPVLVNSIPLNSPNQPDSIVKVRVHELNELKVL